MKGGSYKFVTQVPKNVMSDMAKLLILLYLLGRLSVWGKGEL